MTSIALVAILVETDRSTTPASVIARFADVPSVFGIGGSADEALASLQESYNLFVEVQGERGISVEPREVTGCPVHMRGSQHPPSVGEWVSGGGPATLTTT